MFSPGPGLARARIEESRKEPDALFMSLIYAYRAKEWVRSGDLYISSVLGLACQADKTKLIDYGQEYIDDYNDKRGSEIAKALNEARVELVRKYWLINSVLDYGIGSGEFIESRNKSTLINTFGYDINPVGVDWLRERELYRWNVEDFEAVCMWDTLEHIPEPSKILSRISKYLFMSCPIIDDITKVRESKHYKPGEHLYYFTEDGLKLYMDAAGFRCLEVNDDEVKAGRTDIKTFVFKRRKQG
jgi:hypothetical protein